MDEFLYGRVPQLLDGALVTLQLGITVVPVMILLGLLGAAAKLSKHLPVRLVGDTYTTIIRGVPELVVILLIYFGGTIAVQNLIEMLTTAEDVRIDISPFWAGVTALGLVHGAFASEVFRAAFLAIPPGQIEAALACGMSPWKVFWRIQLPQLWRYALPGLNNLFQILIKDTALISVVGLEETMRKASIAAGNEKAPFTFYLAAMVIFLTFTTVSLLVFGYMERRSRRGISR